jgi:tRNA-2-methylthio-N6-dimethylallyladenosine synthase
MTRTYLVETYGCQMNVHDSERIAGLLEADGYVPVEQGKQADLVVFNTCAVRENADNKLYGNLSFLAPVKKLNPAMQIAVGGCLAQKDQATILKKAPYVDVVFGTHNVGSLPVLLERARIEEESQIEILEALEHFPSTLPAKRFSDFTAWVSVSVGCNNTCTFCIVPTLRGIEKDRPASEILREINTLVDSGVIEITLLGQNVNAYGVDFGDRAAFANLLKECGKIAGLERVRFMSPHPRDFTDDVIDAMASTPNVMPHLHMPLQSGSNRILQEMRRSYRTDRYLGILDRVRTAMPHSQVTTDIIVGFPGETEEDFNLLADFITQAQLDAIGIFGYSDEDKTEALDLSDKVDPEIIAERVQSLSSLADEMVTLRAATRIGEQVRVLIEDEENQEGRAAHQGPEVDGTTSFVGTSFKVGEYVDGVITQSLGADLIARPL